MRSRIKILLVDDHPVVRKGISSCLARHGHLLIVGEAADGVEAVAKARELLPDIMLLDLGLPQMSGLAVAEVLHKELPSIKVIIFSMYQCAEYLPRILQSGARGYVVKDASPEQLVRAIETVTAGECYFTPEIARLALTEVARGKGAEPDLAKLSDREREVFILLANGLGNKEIANNLGIGVRTVDTHRERLMSKLAMRSVAGLTRFALARRLIALPDELAPWDQDLLAPERVDRNQAGRVEGRKVAGEYTDGGAKGDGDNHGPGVTSGMLARGLIHSSTSTNPREAARPSDRRALARA